MDGQTPQGKNQYACDQWRNRYKTCICIGLHHLYFEPDTSISISLVGMEALTCQMSQTNHKMKNHFSNETIHRIAHTGTKTAPSTAVLNGVPTARGMNMVLVLLHVLTLLKHQNLISSHVHRTGHT
jgi:hypothetical protein